LHGRYVFVITTEVDCAGCGINRTGYKWSH